ncbi:MAG: DUF502 domain-containing protein [Planctomycetota bacterium]
MSFTKNPIGFTRTTAIGGLLFLLPLIVLGALIGQIVPIVLTIAQSLAGILDGIVETPGGIALLILMSIGILLLICFFCGLLARRSFARRFSGAFEKKLVMVFPRYAILKDQMADTIGGEQATTQMKPVLASFDDCDRIAFETERDEKAGWVTVYLPGSPDPWSGSVALLKLDRVRSLDADFGDTAGTCEQLGRGSISLIQKSLGTDVGPATAESTASPKSTVDA